MSDEAPGWDAIEAAVPDAARGRGIVHFGSNRLPDTDGIYGLNAYHQDDAWLLVTLGLSELFTKVTHDPDVSGWGFELTLLTPRGAAEEQPPRWALQLLDSLGQYVFSSGRPLADGHRMDAGAPLTGHPEDPETAMAFVTDPHIPSTRSVLGTVDFLRVLGITANELDAMKRTSTATVLHGQIQPRNPRLMTPHSTAHAR